MVSGYYVGEAKSGMTNECLNVVLECLDSDTPVLYISTEMNAQTTAWKLVELMTGVDMSIRKDTKDLSKTDEKAVLAAIRKIKVGAFYFSGTNGTFDISEIERTCQKAIEEHGVKHIIIDRVSATTFFVAKNRLVKNIMKKYNVGITLAKQGVRGSGLTFTEFT